MVVTGPCRQFRLVLIKPSHYDDQGYVIQWFRSSMPSNSLAAVYGLAMDCVARQVLGADILVDTLCHRIPRFIDKAGRAGVVRVFIGLESINPDSLLAAITRRVDQALLRIGGEAARAA